MSAANGATKPFRWQSECQGCNRERELQTRYDHAAKALCDECATRPHLKPRPPESGGPRTPSGRPRRSTRALKLTPAADVRARPVRFLVESRVPLGAVTLVAGEPGLGKSTWTCDLAAGVTTGRIGGQPVRVLIANAEDGPDTVIKPRLAAAGADLALVEFVEVTDDSGDRGFTLPDDLDLLQENLAASHARVLVLDPLNAFLSAAIDGHKDQQVRRAIAPLAKLAHDHQLAVVVTVHLNKAAGTSPVYRVGGSIGLVGGARSLLTFTRDPDDPDGEAGSQRLLAHSKSNWGQLAPTLVYRVEPADLTLDGHALTTTRLALLGESDVTGFDVLRTDAEDTPPRQLERAIELLADMLGDQAEHRASDIREAAKKNNISQKTLERAGAKVGVVTDRRGFPAVAFWSLPPSCAIRPDATADAPVASTTLAQLGEPRRNGRNPAQDELPGASCATPESVAQLQIATLDEEALVARAQQLLDAEEIEP